MTLRTLRRPGSDPIDVSHVRKLGRDRRGLEYVEHNGREYLMTASTVDAPDDLAAGSDDIVVSVPKVATDGGRTMTVGAQYRLGQSVPAGTWDEVRGKEQRRHTPASSRPIDALDGIPALARRQPLIAGGSSGSVAPIALRAHGSMDPGRGPIRGRAILELLQSRGIRLSAVNGRLLVTAPRGHAGGTREILDAAAPLLLGYVTGHPLPCELRHDGKPPEAVTLAVGGLAICEQHRTGELTA